MNIYTQRLEILNAMLEFLKKIYTPAKLRYWQDIECNRDGVPQRLWRLREHLKLDIDSFAHSIGLSPTYYGELEKIGARVPEYVIESVARKYRINKEWLRAKDENFE